MHRGPQLKQLRQLQQPLNPQAIPGQQQTQEIWSDRGHWRRPRLWQSWVSVESRKSLRQERQRRDQNHQELEVFAVRVVVEDLPNPRREKWMLVGRQFYQRALKIYKPIFKVARVVTWHELSDLDFKTSWRREKALEVAPSHQSRKRGRSAMIQGTGARSIPVKMM